MSNFNFGYNIIDKRAAEFPDKIAVETQTESGFCLKISTADLHHHSDVAAYYLQKMGIKSGSRVLLCGLEKSFEFAIVLTALHKLYAVAVFDLLQNAVDCANAVGVYAIISANNSPVVQQVTQNISNLKTAEVLISVGNPCPEYWFDLHTGMRLAKTFKPLKNIPQNYSSLIIFNENTKIFNKNYPLETQTDYFFDNFYKKMVENEVWNC